MHTVAGTAANVNDVTYAGALVQGEEADVFADAGYQGVTRTLLEKSRLMDVIPVGHSDAGFVVAGVCDRTPERIGHVVFMDTRRS